MASTAKTKTISQIGNTKLELVKDTYDSFVFKLDASGANPASQNTVMYISSDTDGSKPSTTDVSPPIATSGLVSMSNAKVNGNITSGGNVIVGNQLHLKKDEHVRGAIYAEDGAGTDNRSIIIDPYPADASTDTDVNKGTVYIRGSLIVEGDKTILDTAEHITSDNLFGINASLNESGNAVGGSATTAGIHVYSSGYTATHFVHDFSTGSWLTGENSSNLTDFQAKDIHAKNITAKDGNLVIKDSSDNEKFKVEPSNGDTTIAGTLSVSSTTSVSTNLIVGNPSVPQTLPSAGHLYATQINGTLAGNVSVSTGTSNFNDVDISTLDVTSSLGVTGTIQFTDTTESTTHSIFGTGTITSTNNDSVKTRTLGDNTIHVNAKGVNSITVGNIVPVELASGTVRLAVQTVSSSVNAAPLHADILNYFAGKAFAAGKCVAALTNGVEASVAMFSFSICGSILTMVLDQEVHSNTSTLNLDYDSVGTIALTLGTATAATYCVKVLPVMTSDSITEKY